MTNQNHCPICRCTISPELLMCSKHWGLVPLKLRTRILGLYRTARGGDAHRSACFEAVRSVLTLLRPQPPRAA